MRDRRILILSLAGILVGCATVASAVFAIVGGAASNRPNRAADVQHLLQSEIAKLPRGEITSAKLDSPSSADITAGVPDRGDNWLWITAKAANNIDAVAAEFDASFLATDFVQKATAAHLADVTGITVDVFGNTADRPLEEGAWFVPAPSQVPFPSVNPNLDAAKAAIRTRFASGAQTAGGTLKDVAFRTSLPRLTVDATVAVSDPHRFVENSRLRITSIIGGDDGYDGRVLRIVDTSGAPVMIAAANPRLGAGAVWIAPEYQADYASPLHS